MPAAGVIGGAVYRGLLFTAVLAVAAAFIGAEVRLRWLRLLLFFATAAAMVLELGLSGGFPEAVSIAPDPADVLGVWDSLGGTLQLVGMVPCDCVHRSAWGRIGTDRAAGRFLPEPGLCRIDGNGSAAGVAAGGMAAATGRESHRGVALPGQRAALGRIQRARPHERE